MLSNYKSEGTTFINIFYAVLCYVTGRAPALLDSLDQAVVTAPLFVFLEVLFALGYRKDFYKSMMVQVEKNIKEFQAKKSK